jgi:hypothetical protein
MRKHQPERTDIRTKLASRIMTKCAGSIKLNKSIFKMS